MKWIHLSEHLTKLGESHVNFIYKSKVELVDSANIVARSLKQQLEALNLLSDKTDGNDQFLVSDYTPAFEKAARLFFNKEIHLEKYPLWE